MVWGWNQCHIRIGLHCDIKQESCILQVRDSPQSPTTYILKSKIIFCWSVSGLGGKGELVEPRTSASGDPGQKTSHFQTPMMSQKWLNEHRCVESKLWKSLHQVDSMSLVWLKYYQSIAQNLSSLSKFDTHHKPRWANKNKFVADINWSSGIWNSPKLEPAAELVLHILSVDTGYVAWPQFGPMIISNHQQRFLIGWFGRQWANGFFSIRTENTHRNITFFKLWPP